MSLKGLLLNSFRAYRHGYFRTFSNYNPCFVKRKFLPFHWQAALTTLIACLFFVCTAHAQYPAGTPVAINGKLSIAGGQLVNECGNAVQLRGMSSHGPQWFQNCYSSSSLNALVNDWGIDIFRVAMYVEEGGYVNNPSYWRTWIDNMVEECAKRGIYCMIDWHVLNPGDPWANMAAAREFFTYMSTKHSGKKHVLYEIANEPNGVPWSRVKTYAEDIIPRIRANDPSSIVIVGTPNWSQDVDVAAADPLNFSNIMYALHFYSGTHTDWLRTKANTALSKGLALYVTEFGTSQASGDGGPYLEETQRWINWMATNKISWINWSFADKAEISAALSPGACSGGSWNATTQSGAFIKERILSPADNFNCSSGTTTYTISATSGTGGTISPNGNVSVAAGGNQTFTITPSSGYAIDRVTVNGTSVGAVSSYSFTNVQANGTIAASFRTATATQQAYPNGVAHAIPGAIESVNYDTGGEGVAYHDTSTGNAGSGPRANEHVDTEYRTTAGNVGWIAAGEWLEYTVNVSEAGTYSLAVQVASSPGGGAYHVEFNGVDKTGKKTVGATGGWSTFVTQTHTGISLAAGTQVMRVYMDAGSFNLARMTFSLSGSGGNTAPKAVVSAKPTTGQAPLAVSFDGSGSSDADGDPLSYSWVFGDGTTGIGRTVSHTYTAAGAYTATLTVSDGKGGTGRASVAISVSATSGGGDCSFGTPRASALPSINKSFAYVHVLGSGGPDLNNVSSFTIKWDLANRGLYQFSMNTTNGNPAWYVDLLGKLTHTFSQAQPSITITGSGIAGFDGSYLVNLVNGDFVMVSATGSFSLYFSGSAVAPACSASARIASEKSIAGSSGIAVYPNPFSDEVHISLDKPELVSKIVVFNHLGQFIQELNKAAIENENTLRFGPSLKDGIYLIQIESTDGSKYIRLIKN